MIVIDFRVYFWPKPVERSCLGEPAASGGSMHQTPKHGRPIMNQSPNCRDASLPGMRCRMQTSVDQTHAEPAKPAAICGTTPITPSNRAIAHVVWARILRPSALPLIKADTDCALDWPIREKLCEEPSCGRLPPTHAKHLIRRYRERPLTC